MSNTDNGFYSPGALKPEDVYNRTSTGLGTAPTWLVPRTGAGNPAASGPFEGLMPGPAGPPGIQGPPGTSGYPPTSGHEGDVLAVIDGVPVWVDPPAAGFTGITWEDV